VFVLPDDLGWMDLGCYGSTTLRTPNLDRRAAEGIRFTHGSASTPWCSSTRIALHTGRKPRSHRRRSPPLPPEHPGLPRRADPVRPAVSQPD